MTRVKICGLTRAEDAALATELGADFLGLIFVKESPRYVTPEQARAIVPASGQRPAVVGVFRGASAEEIQAVAEEARLDLVQVHGPLPGPLTLPLIHAFRVEGMLPDTSHSRGDYLLFDTGGGTGRTFDWTLLQGHDRRRPFFLAGGLTPDNVAEAIRIARPDAIDLSSGIESAPGIKDPHKMRSLFERVSR